MYKGFNLKLTKDFFEKKNLNEASFNYFYGRGVISIKESKASIEETIESFVGVDGSLDGSKMQANWFPQIKADVFISHSHKDLKLAIALAGWLNETFGLTAFIDSCVWGYANKLLKMIDDEYCYQKETNTYNYQKRNYSTSHVHMMLSVALTQMIDNTECLFFLNTPNSLTPNPIVEQTESPWIYSEIAMSRLVRKKLPKREKYGPLNESHKTFATGGEDMRMRHKVFVGHLTAIGVNTLLAWEDDYNNSPEPEEIALDTLYKLTIGKDGK